MTNPILTGDQLRAIQEEILDKLKVRQAQLETIQALNLPIVEKWQRLLLILLPIQLRVIKASGFQNEQEALISFGEQYMEQASNDSSLWELNKQKWLFIFDKAFGVFEFKEITIEEARNLVSDIVEEMTSEQFLQRIDDALNQLKGEVTIIDKRNALLSLLFPLQVSIMARHGFEGDLGYIQAQRALMDYYFDPMIRNNFTRAQSAVFSRARLQ